MNLEWHTLVGRTTGATVTFAVRTNLHIFTFPFLVASFFHAMEALGRSVYASAICLAICAEIAHC